MKRYSDLHCDQRDNPKSLAKLHYILFFKPYGVLSQFTKEGSHRTLGDFGPFPRNVYPAGRLDADSEGLLLLTNDNSLKDFLTNPKFGHPRTYVVQVEGIPSEEAIQRLREGVMIQGKKTRPADVRILQAKPQLPTRPVPIRLRKSVPTAWLEMTLREGRNRQIRRMTAAVGFPTLRLVRTKIGNLSLEGLQIGEMRTLTEKEIRQIKRLHG